MKTLKLLIETDGTANGSSVADEEGRMVPVKSICIKIEPDVPTIITLELYQTENGCRLLKPVKMTANFTKEEDEEKENQTDPSQKL